MEAAAVKETSMQTILKMTELDLKGKRVLIREDLNVPIADGKVTSEARIRAALPTIQHALDAGAKVLLMSHLGRPGGKVDPAFSLAPVADRLTGLLGQKVRLISDWIDGVDVDAGEVVLFENVRFFAGEKTNNDAHAKKMAALCDIYVMDAFGTAHRAEASTHGVAKYAPIACAGPLLSGELDALSHALENPARPLVAIVGGSKASTKISVLDSLSVIVDQLIVGGGIANTFIAAAGHAVGKSLHEADRVDEAKRLSQAANKAGGSIPVPSDVVVAQALSPQAEADVKAVNAIDDNDMVLDIGPDTAEAFAKLLKTAGTIVWNGPVGVFEFDQFGEGTRHLAEAIAESSAFSIAGGGDTLAAIEKYGVEDRISYISTGGGAFLEFLEGKKLPAVEILEQRGKQRQD